LRTISFFTLALLLHYQTYFFKINTKMVKLSVCTLATFIVGASAFAPMTGKYSSSTKLSMSADEAAASRRSFFTKAAGSAAVVALGLVEAPEGAQAIGSLKKVNEKLSQ
jgi:hypothetical protein